MEVMIEYAGKLSNLLWGEPLMGLLLGTGLFLMVRLRAMPLKKIGYGFKQLFSGRKSQGEGDITPFNALMTSLSATIGTGNIAGVATAIGIGGPGALFWMWCTALVGMATKYAEAVLAVKYREVDEEGRRVGGPMYYIKNGLGEKWKWLGTLFAIFGTLAGFGLANTVQSNSVANALRESFAVPVMLTGVVLAVLVALVLLGGIKRIGNVAGKLVPFMALSYLACGLVVLAFHFTEIPSAVVTIVESAFTPVSAVGGFAGASVWLAIQRGVARGMFSNEAGLGSAPIAHAAAQTNSPVRQGVVAMLGTFIDTLIVCSVTGLCIVVTGVWTSGAQGVNMTQAAFNMVLPYGDTVISLGLVLFAFTTMLGWSYYGERCAEYLFGVKAIVPFRVAWVLAIPVGAVVKLDLVWIVADILNALMAIPNLIGLILLSPVVVKLTRDYFESRAAVPELS
ncbi:sodium:alanine symporter family protein [Exilibacterium tricleocarpae]|uniref:Sodium:alanine symporter family protein n=2 Tax=Exilibacterium tricleocarpae TaxID=2591008 RepID=A0A545T8H6_9GAMM|nr:sodium:alanine symporter family protein [Exilibacterium tricleocarpae]TQV73511.1 sodium:alanine symporter family protein [Exilibacterium tricleocarpae]